ncbi:MAG: hypothetical protein J5636_11720 [Clostridiales bacterium]|nr:hypothetical protein [Clostridiales bacterium]
MKRSACVAVILAAGMLMTSCSKAEETTKKKKKAKKTTKTEDTTDPEDDPTSETGEPSESTDEPTDTTATPTDTEPTDTEPTDTDPTDTDPTDTTPSRTSEMVPNPTFDFEEDAMRFFEDDGFRIPDIMFTFCAPENSTWSLMVSFYEEDGTFEGQYKTAFVEDTSAGPVEQVMMCDFSGTYDGFTRVNEYSYSAHITDIGWEEFDAYDTEEYGQKQHVSFVEPYGFSDPDELILYLPNTPMNEFPGYALGRVGNLLRDKDGDYLQDYVIYSPDGTDVMALLVAAPTMPELTTPDKDSMEGWLGHYYDKTGLDGSIEYDAVDDKYVFNGVFENTRYVKGATILQAKDDERTLVFYYEDDEGYMIVQMEVADGLVAAYALYSTFPEVEAAKFYYPRKDG